MGRTHDHLDDALRDWIERQPMFFVATAPSGADGHVNLSPKGLDTFRVLDPRTVAYLDLTGSGVETVAHLRDNGRLTMMFCAFDGPPRIVRLYGTGQVVQPGEAGFEDLVARFPGLPGVRSVIRLGLERIQTSCGYGVPEMGYVGQRERLTDWAEARGDDGIIAYQRDRNAESIDGLPGMAD